MEFDSEELWVEGDQVQSQHEDVLDFLNENSGWYFTASSISEEALGDASLDPETVEGLSEEEYRIQEIMSFSALARTETILSQLVREGSVEKREIPMQAVAQQMDEELDLSEKLPEEVANVPYESDFDGQTTEYYRISAQIR